MLEKRYVHRHDYLWPKRKSNKNSDPIHPIRGFPCLNVIGERPGPLIQKKKIMIFLFWLLHIQVLEQKKKEPDHKPLDNLIVSLLLTTDLVSIEHLRISAPCELRHTQREREA